MARFEFYDLPPEAKEKIVTLRAELAANRVLLAGYRLSALLDGAKFNPNQPRVPAGSGRESGWWAGSGGGSGSGTPDQSSPGAADELPSFVETPQNTELRPIPAAYTPAASPNNASGVGRRTSTSDAEAVRRRLFDTSKNELVQSRLLTGEEAQRFTFDSRYTAFRYEDRSGADVAVPGSGKYFATKEELDAFLQRNGRYGYTEARGSTNTGIPIFGTPTSVIYSSATHAGYVEGFVNAFSPSQMMNFAIMHEYAHQIGIRTEYGANAYAAGSLRITNTPRKTE